MPTSSQWEIPLERKGGTSPTANPHVCVYSAAGATHEVCVSITKIYRRNVDGCRAVKCNAAWRLCYKCIEERAVKPERVRNPIVGLCDRHGVGAGLYTKEQATTGAAPHGAIAILREELATMAQSTAAECARLDDLNDHQRFILHQLAYGFDTVQIDRVLAKRAGAEGLSFSSTFPIICRKLGIEGVLREKDRIYKAGKIYLDAKELEREQTSAPILRGDDESPSNTKDHADATTDVTEASEPGEPVELVADEVEPVDVLDAADAEPPAKPTEERKVMTKQSQELRDALAIAARFKRSRTSDEPAPHVTDLYSAVHTMRSEDMKGETIGEAFGYEGASGAQWASVIVSFSRVSQAAWKVLGARDISISAMKKISLLPANEQPDAIKEWFAKPVGKTPNNVQQRAPKAAQANTRSRQAASAAPPEHDDEPVQLPATASATAPVVHERPSNGNGHSFASLLPVRISLQGLGDFTDIDIEPVTLGQDASAERMARIASRRQSGFKPVEVVMHPALPSAQIIYTKE